MAAIRLISQLPHRRGALTLTRAKANTTSLCREVLRRGISLTDSYATLEQIEREKRARQRASMGHD
jgi:hypothetical protein